MIFAPDGTFLESLGEGVFARAHGITVGPDGKLLRTLGGEPSDTGATSMDYRSILRAGPPFHYPCNLAIAPGGTPTSATAGSHQSGRGLRRRSSWRRPSR